MYDVDDEAVRGGPHGHGAGTHEERHRVEQVRKVTGHVQAVVEWQHELQEKKILN